jgi:Cdc6-like AAA superfamily ATPase
LRENLAKRALRTGQWLFDSAQYMEWFGQNGKTLFLYGAGASGKSMMASIIIDNLSKMFHNDSTVGLCYIFCSSDREHEETLQDLMSSLLKQLSQRHAQLPRIIQGLYNHRNRMRSRASLDKILPAIMSLLLSFSRTFIIVDGLDKCVPSIGTRFTSEILFLQANTKANILVTSRKSPHVMEIFLENESIIMEMQMTADFTRVERE